MHPQITKLTKLVRYFILKSTTQAGSGHPTSSLSGVDVMTSLFANGYFKADLDNPENKNNDRLIFSKGHASPLFYSLYTLVDKVDVEELLTLRKFGSRLEGHPTMDFPYTESATGSLGQGLGIGAGMALNAKINKLDYKTFVLLGDSELAEGSNWEAAQIASFYNLNNLIALVDINRLGQRGETMEGWDVSNYKLKFEAFGFEVYTIDGHDLEEIDNAFKDIEKNLTNKPKVILAKTKKGSGISFLEDKEGWHGKALKAEEFEKAISELGSIDQEIRINIPMPKEIDYTSNAFSDSFDVPKNILEAKEKNLTISPRKAYGLTLAELGNKDEVIVLDAETSNSTFADIFKREFPNRFVECFIAEQNMVSMALGLSRRGKVPFVSTFAAFFSRAFDQIRMSQYSNSNIKFVGSHAGVSIGEDGASQMALEDLAMFRAVSSMTVVYPSDAVSVFKLCEQALKNTGNFYIRITRADLPIIYDINEEFQIGGSKTLKSSTDDKITIFAAGITLHESLKAYDELLTKGIKVRIVDLYSIKPIDREVILKACQETNAILVVEDHYQEGGVYEAICASGSVSVPVHSLAVNKTPHSGTPSELLKYAEIDSEAITMKTMQILSM